MKVVLATGIDTINAFIKEIQEVEMEIIDECTDLDLLKEIIQYSGVDTVIINRYLDESDEGGKIKNIIREIRAKNKEIRFIILLGEYETKFISSMVNIGIYDLIIGEEASSDLIENILKNPRQEFDFNKYLAVKKEEAKQKVRVEVVEKVQSVFKQVFAIYSPLSEGSSKVAAHFAVALARAKNCRVCLVDFNPIKPRQKDIFNMNFECALGDALDNIVKKTLTTEKLEGIVMQSKVQRNLDILFGLYDINDYYSSKLEQYEEVIDKLKFIYDYVIIDTHSWFDVLPTDAALRKADRVIIPIRGCRYSIEELKRCLETFEKYNDFDVSKFRVVINQYSAKDLTSIEIDAKLPYEILGYISRNNLYHDGNAFRNIKLMNEYIDILNAIDISTKKKKEPMEYLNFINWFKTKTVKKKESKDA